MKAQGPYPLLARFFDIILTFLLFMTGLWIIITMGAISYHVFSASPPDLEWLNMNAEFRVDAPPMNVSTADGQSLTLSLEDVTGKLELPPDERGLRIGAAVAGLFGLILSYLSMWPFREIVRSLRCQNPFIAANAKHLRFAGWMILAGAIWKTVAEGILAAWASQRFTGLNPEVGISFTSPSVAFALALLLLAEVFKIGVKMKEEQDLTV